MNVYIGNDHGGYQIKKVIMRYLNSNGHHVINVGSDNEEIVRYPYYASQVASAVSSGKADRGILICNSGIGMSIAANKYRGVRASLVHDSKNAKLTRMHNDSNILCLGGKVLNEKDTLDILQTWFNTDFLGDRHSISLGLINEIEQANFNNNCWSLNDIKNEAT